MRKILSSTFAVILTTVMGLSACAPQPTAQVVPGVTPIKPTSTAEKTTPTPVAVENDFEVDIAGLEGIQIHFLHPWTGETLELLYKMVDQFNQTNEWGIHVIMTAPGSAAQVTSRLREEISNDIQSSVVVAPVSLLLAIDEAHDLVMDLEPYIESGLFGLDPSLVEDFNPVFWDEDMINGKRFAIPAQRSALLMVYNSSWAQELGFKAAPQTVDEFREQVCAANTSFRNDDDPSDDGLGGWVLNTDSSSVYNWLLAFGADPFTNGIYDFSNSPSLEAFQYLYNIEADACAWTSRTTQDADRFASREALVYTLWMQDLGRQAATMARSGSGDEWAVLAHPGMEKGTVLTGGSSYAVLHRDEESDLAAWLFIRWLSQPAQQARLLATMGTLPLGSMVLEQMGEYGGQNPYWQETVNKFNRFELQPIDADWPAVAPVLQDAAWQLWMTEITAEQIPEILKQMDDLTQELAERFP